jgi:hypothetical protein
MIRAAVLARRAALAPPRLTVPTRSLASKAEKRAQKATAKGPAAAPAGASSANTDPLASGQAPAPTPAPMPTATGVEDTGDAAASRPPTSSAESAAGPSSAQDASTPTPIPSLQSLDFTSTLSDSAKLAAPKGAEGGEGAGGELGPGARTGARSAKGSLSSIERRRRFLGRAATGVMMVAFGLFTYDLGREWSVDEVKEKKWVRGLFVHVKDLR